MELADLHNPQGIKAILPNNNGIPGIPVELNSNQGWQETKGRWELWELFDNGILGFVKSWNKKAVIATYI